MSSSDQNQVPMHLVISKDRASFVESGQQHELLKHYVHLITQAFLLASSIEAQDNELQTTQPQTEQAMYLQHFEQRVAKLMQESASAGKSLTLHDAQCRAWQEIEKELLRYPTDDTEPDQHHN